MDLLTVVLILIIVGTVLMYVSCCVSKINSRGGLALWLVAIFPLGIAIILLVMHLKGV